MIDSARILGDFGALHDIEMLSIVQSSFIVIFITRNKH